MTRYTTSIDLNRRMSDGATESFVIVKRHSDGKTIEFTFDELVEYRKYCRVEADGKLRSFYVPTKISDTKKRRLAIRLAKAGRESWWG